MRRKWVVVAAAAATVTSGVAGAAIASEALGASGAPVALQLSTTSSWNGGAVFNWLITDTSAAPVNGWKLAFSLPAGVSITNVWNVSSAVSGTRMTVTNLSWDQVIAPGQTRNFGFQVSTTGSTPTPSNCAFNGAVLSCGASSTGTTTTTAPPTTTTTAPRTTTTTTTSPPVTTTTTVPATTTTTTPAGGGSGPGTIPDHYFAPYVDMTEYPEFGLAAAEKATGQKYFSLAFVVEGASGCQPSWGGYYPVSQQPPYGLSDIENLRAEGGDVIVSFGGAAGTELAQSCTNVSQLEAAYQQVIDTYDATHIDFDIEGAAVADAASITRRDEAIAALQAAAAVAGRTLKVSFTLPVLPTGLTSDGTAVVQDAIAHGVTLSVVNVMTMDYGDGAAPNPAGMMGTYADEAASSTESQLAALYPHKSVAQLWAMVGITPMIGVNDVTDEVMQLSDARQQLTFAEQHGVGELSMWSSTRDVECPGGAQTYSQPTCSSIVQSPNAFTELFEPFSG